MLSMHLLHPDMIVCLVSVELDPNLVTNIVVQTAQDETSAFVNTFSRLITTLLGGNNDLRVRIYLLCPRTLSQPAHKIDTRCIISIAILMRHLTVFAAGCACLAVTAEGFDCSRWVSPWILHRQVQR